MGKTRPKSDDEILKTFGARLRDAREVRGMTQEQVAGLCEMSRSYLAGVETGRHNIGIAKVIRIADVLGISPAEFFAGPGVAKKRRR
jgi:transcriptional regulator with XRE-family HTH domain